MKIGALSPLALRDMPVAVPSAVTAPRISDTLSVAARPARVDGGVVLDTVIDELAQRVRKGERCAIAWDIDGTLVDTRPRMLACVHALGRTDVTLDALTSAAPDWRDVARDLKIDPDAFFPVWDRVFWQYDAFAHDLTMKSTLSRMQRAAELGIENIVITGRNTNLEKTTRRDLEARGVPFSALYMKPQGSGSTSDVKADIMGRLVDSGVHLGAFVTDSIAEVQAVVRSGKAANTRNILVATSNRTIDGAQTLNAHVWPVKLEAGARYRPDEIDTAAARSAAIRSWIGLQGTSSIRHIKQAQRDRALRTKPRTPERDP